MRLYICHLGTCKIISNVEFIILGTSICNKNKNMHGHETPNSDNSLLLERGGRMGSRKVLKELM